MIVAVLVMNPHSTFAFLSNKAGPLLRTSSRTKCFRAFSIPTNNDDQESENEDSRRVHRIQWKTANGSIQFEAFDGETLRTAALRRGVVSPHNGRSKLINCRGLGTCGTCAVEIIAGSVNPKERNNIERIRLSLPPHGSENQSSRNLRLACQIQVRGDLEITKRSGFWGQHDSLSTSSEHKTYFGDLEFILDNKSPDP